MSRHFPEAGFKIRNSGYGFYGLYAAYNRFKSPTSRIACRLGEEAYLNGVKLKASIEKGRFSLYQKEAPHSHQWVRYNRFLRVSNYLETWNN